MAVQRVLVAVGGTGQHLAISYLNLARLAGFKPDPIVVLDNDNAGPVIKELNRIAGDLLPPGALKQLPPVPRHAASQTPRLLFTSPQDQPFLDLFLRGPDPENPAAGSEQDADVLSGFYGYPHLGSLLARPVFEGAPNVPSFFRTILGSVTSGGVFPTALAQGSTFRVVLAGSVIGGCGAGVMPQVVEALDLFAKQSGCQMQLCVLASLPYFDLGALPAATLTNADDQSAKADARQIDGKVLLQNATSGLAHFEDMLLALAQRTVFLGAPHGSTEVRTNDSHKAQGLSPHYLHIVGGVLAHLALHASGQGLSKQPGDDGLRLFSSGQHDVAPGALPVPDQELIASVNNNPPHSGFAVDDFNAGLNVQWRAGALQALVPGNGDSRISLERWLWQARIQLELADVAMKRLGSRIAAGFAVLDGHDNLEDQLRRAKARESTSERVGSLAQLTRGALDWIRDGFLKPDDQNSWLPRPGTGCDPGALEMILPAGYGSWASAHGMVLKRLVAESASGHMTDGRPSGFWAFWSQTAQQSQTPEAFAREIFDRCRKEAGRLVDQVYR